MISSIQKRTDRLPPICHSTNRSKGELGKDSQASDLESLEIKLKDTGSYLGQDHSSLRPIKDTSSLIGLKAGGAMNNDGIHGSKLKIESTHAPITNSALLLNESQNELEDEVLVGPVKILMTVHYIWFGIILIISRASNWNSGLNYWTIPLYFNVAFFAGQVARLTSFHFPTKPIPLYSSLIPFILFHLMAREAGLVLGILWFGSTLSILIQTGIKCNGRHITIFTLIFLVVYLCDVAIMVYTFDQPPSTLFASEFQSPIQWESQVLVVMGILFVAIITIKLHQFIHLFAEILRQRNRNAQSLYDENHQLKLLLKKRSEQKSKLSINLDSPITKVIRFMQSIATTMNLDPASAERLNFAMEILSSNKLYAPTLKFGKNILFCLILVHNLYKEVSGWLKTFRASESRTSNSTSFSLQSRQSEASSSPESIITVGVSGNQKEIADLLKKGTTWDFDIFQLNKLTKGKPLLYLAHHIFEDMNVFSSFNIEPTTMQRFLTVIGSSYHSSNPYHNRIHAADVTQAVYYFFKVQGLDAFLSQQNAFALFLSAIIHDVDHPGVNNAFLINTSSPLAIRYNDKSVLESHHCATAFEYMLKDPSLNVLLHMSPVVFQEVRTQMVSCVLATDMAQHFEYITRFKNKTQGTGFDFKENSDQQLFMDMAIKCADINNPTRNHTICLEWTKRIMEEFFLQGEEEEKLGIPVSKFMDRKTTAVSKCQLGFIDYIVLPLFEPWDNFMNESGDHPHMKNISENKEYWIQVNNNISNNS